MRVLSRVLAVICVLASGWAAFLTYRAFDANKVVLVGPNEIILPSERPPDSSVGMGAEPSWTWAGAAAPSQVLNDVVMRLTVLESRVADLTQALAELRVRSAAASSRSGSPPAAPEAETTRSRGAGGEKRPSPSEAAITSAPTTVFNPSQLEGQLRAQRDLFQLSVAGLQRDIDRIASYNTTFMSLLGAVAVALVSGSILLAIRVFKPEKPEPRIISGT